MTAQRRLRDARSRPERATCTAALHDDERATLLAFADDLPQLRNHPALSNETRKRILRVAREEIVFTVEGVRPAPRVDSDALAHKSSVSATIAPND
jgi:hypothetical protein